MSDCKGCNSTHKNDFQPPLCLVYLAKDKCGGCPCIACLIKTMCSQLCETRVKYFSEISTKYIDAVNRAYKIREKKLK
jgi:hypothetical protein